MTPQETLKALLDYLRISANRLATVMGYKRTDSLYRILNGNAASITGKMANDITKAYPQISYHWLISGQGDMLLEQAVDLSKEETKKALEIIKEIEGKDREIAEMLEFIDTIV